MKCSNWRFLFSVLLLIPLALNAAVNFSKVAVEVNQQGYVLEYAHTAKQRSRGLMYRQQLCENCGMLFRFSSASKVTMWMKNTPLDLDIAFVSPSGVIREVRRLQANDETIIRAHHKTLHAWEMHAGWFARNAIKVGDTIRLKPLE
ncbi:DUF192 domain-containing protein [Agarivorans sp.]|uniref:DUF192 domain-containing protein n=1 Tax=Agarivorans sp. TaxID=1872412 RepID=UPI003CFD5EA6